MNARNRWTRARKGAALAATAAVFALAGAAAPGGAQAGDPELQVGFGTRVITPHGPSPAGWDFWVNPVTGIWSEEFIDENGDGCWQQGELHIDDPRNSLIDPQSTGKWDGIWANAGFGGKCALGVHDDIWARAVVISDGTRTAAMVSVDVVGWFYEEIQRGRNELAAARPDIALDTYVVSATHTHNGPDTMGLWGQPFPTDGKFPLYQAYIRSQINEAIAEAYDALEPAAVRFGHATHTTGLRDSRPPFVIDPDVWSAQFVRPDETTIGTLINWSNHPEALGGSNPYISSDFPHATRLTLENELGGTAVYFSGSVGGLMTPLGYDVPGYGTGTGYDRMVAIGTLLAESAIDSLDGAPLHEDLALEIASKEFFVPIDHQGLRALNAAGVFDKPTYTAGLPTHTVGQDILTEMVAVGLGPAVFVTVPGELFPEIAIGGYGRTDCPAADTGRPHEPVIRDQFDVSYHFVLGLGQDELGYIVPGYDFWISGIDPSEDDLQSDGPRPPIVLGVDRGVDPCGVRHYEETVSASSVLAPLVACTAAELAGRDPWDDPDAYPACVEENTTVGPMGIDVWSLAGE